MDDRIHEPKLKFAFIFVLIFSVFQSQTYTFTGNGDGTSWTDAANWSGAAGIPYMDDTTCNVNVGAFTVNIPASASLTMESGTVSGSGKIINYGTFTSAGTSAKYFSEFTFENRNIFTLGTGSNVSGFVYLQGNVVFENTPTGQIIMQGIVFAYNGASTVKNAGVLRKTGDYSKTVSAKIVNEGEINVEQGTLVFSGEKEFKTGVFNIAEGATLETNTNNGTFSGIWTGTVNGSFIINGNNSVPAGQTVTNQISGNGITFSFGNLSGAGKFINESIFTAISTSAKYFSLGTFENKGSFYLGTESNLSGFVYLQNNTVFDNTSAGVIYGKGIAFAYNGIHTVKNSGKLLKTGNYSKTYNITLSNNGEIDVQEGTLILSGSNELKTGVYSVSAGAVLETTGTTGMLSGIWTGNIAGNFFLNGTNSVAAATTVTNQLTGNGIEQASGILSGAGTFVNQTIFTASGTSAKYMTLGKFENRGSYRLGTGTNVSGFVYLQDDTLFENTATGEIVVQGLIFSYNGSHSVVNLGNFKKVGNFAKAMNANFTNEGQINVEQGSLTLSGEKILKSGIYNVAENATLETSSGNGTLSGIWTGTVHGKFYLNGNLAVEENTAVTNQISGNGIIMAVGNYSGLGKFINESVFTAEGTSAKYFSIAIFENKGTFNLGDGNNISGFIYLQNGHLFNNLYGGEVTARGIVLANNGPHTFNNSGVLMKLGNFDETFSVTTNNSGSIIGKEGRIIFSGTLNNTATGKISGYAIGTPLGASFTNSGTFSPGLSPGELNVSGQLKLTNGILEIELDGNTPATQYDRISYNGTAAVVLSGNINVILGFAPNVGDEFIVVQSSTAPVTSTLAAPSYAEYNGYHYYFNVSNSSEDVRLTVTGKALATANAETEKTRIYPNPVTDILNYSAKTDLTGFEIYNLAGQKVKSGKQLPAEGKIELGSLVPGQYILRLIFRDRTDHHKFIKK